jgi:hypothetical protein
VFVGKCVESDDWHIGAIDRDLAALIRGHREQLLPYGSPGRLAIDGTAAVLPLDDEKLLRAAKPFRNGGTGVVGRARRPLPAPLPVDDQ